LIETDIITTAKHHMDNWLTVW